MPKNRLKAHEYIKGILNGNRVILSRAITVIESNLESDRILAGNIIQSLLPHTGKSIRIGITGVPGVGKSTFIETFGLYLTEIGHRVAVLSIDPSSRRSKGSILGDKTRMEKLSVSDKAYIRPSASGETLGGIANKTGEAMLLCEAAGYDVILIETVGVGQSETAVHDLTDFFLLLMLAGAGDELQGIKKGIMEMADMIVINKADGDNIRKSEQAKILYQNALHIFPEQESGWTPRVTTASSTENRGIDEIWQSINEFRKLVQNNGYFKQNRNLQQIKWMYSNIDEALKKLFYSSPHIKGHLNILEQEIIAAKISPVTAAQKIIEEFKKSIQNP